MVLKTMNFYLSIIHFFSKLLTCADEVDEPSTFSNKRYFLVHKSYNYKLVKGVVTILYILYDVNPAVPKEDKPKSLIEL